MPRVSIIIPAWNAEQTILRALDSAQSQTINDIEIIVIDDASADSTVDLVKSRALADPRIRLHRLEKTPGRPRREMSASPRPRANGLRCSMLTTPSPLTAWSGCLMRPRPRMCWSPIIWNSTIFMPAGRSGSGSIRPSWVQVFVSTLRALQRGARPTNPMPWILASCSRLSVPRTFGCMVFPMTSACAMEKIFALLSTSYWRAVPCSSFHRPITNTPNALEQYVWSVVNMAKPLRIALFRSAVVNHRCNEQTEPVFFRDG